MYEETIRNHFNLAGGQLIDRWLRFPAVIQARYDSEHAATRSEEVRSAILVGLVLYNVYNITNFLLMSDTIQISLVLRIGFVTPVSLVLAWAVGRMPPLWTERLICLGVMNAYLLPVLLFWLTRHPLGLYSFGELPLTIVFGDMLLALRFRYAALFTGGALFVSLLAVITKPELDPVLRFGFIVQVTTACVFSLYANYRIEHRRCLDFLARLGAIFQASNADQTSIKFHELSRTDALTGLPNRRYLIEKLDEWFTTSDTVTLMMIDVDQFKLYNDALGHLAGDDCLRRIGDAFAKFVQGENEFCARFGGEEFTLVLRNATELQSARRAKELVQAIESLQIVHPSRSDGSGITTISVGMMLRRQENKMSADDLIAAADRALYVAKMRGRNRFVINDGQLAELGETELGRIS